MEYEDDLSEDELSDEDYSDIEENNEEAVYDSDHIEDEDDEVY